MRCVDCLPLIEEYFDGEVTGQTEEQVAAHLAACADCSAALEALTFEQEVYARYDRGGLEVSPDLWARVSAEIARTPLTPESPATRRPFLSRARDYFAAALGVLAVRPALASSLALLIVGAAFGTLWLTRRPQPAVPGSLVAVRTPAPVAPIAVIPPAPAPTSGGVETQGSNNLFGRNEGVDVPAAYEARAAASSTPVRSNVDARPNVADLLDRSLTPKDDGIVKFRQEPERPDDTEKLFQTVSAPVPDVVQTNAQPLEPEQKDVARHVERAQMLLRSIKNARASETGEPDISYEKNLSRRLLAENATLQLEAEVKGDKETKQVLDRIEPFLLDIANMGDKPSREEVRSIRERVRQTEIVASLEVY